MSSALHLPTLKQLRYLVELDRHQHFGQAAEACFVTQSTLSNGIQELENLLGVKLVERTKRTVFMTSLGREIAERSRSLLYQAEDIARLAQHQNTPLSGPFRLGVIPTIAPYLLPSALPLLRQNYPDLQLFLQEDETARLLDKLNAGEIDAALMAFPYETKGVEWIELGRDPFWLACPRSHPLAGESAIELEELFKSEGWTETLILMEEGHCLREHSMAACQLGSTPASQRNPKALRASSLLTLVHMIAGGLGISLLPALACHSGLLQGADISLRPLNDPKGFRILGLAWRKGFTRKNDAKLLAETLRTTTQQLSGKGETA
ncbi:hydrogen peroxide-inducible genes activator [Kiloniella sp. b19]|uniref:hydrogen peroxide-inducible genes activator n=1 Tax=Kiloniella sp. GXU_MW_B19 TaxID=3141326 RepID=UPI0031DDF520